MSLLDLTPEARAAVDAGMPPIFDKGFHPERIDWYTQLCIDAGVRGGVVIIPELIAAMIAESGLQNRRFGDADKTSPHFGVGWMQFDTEYAARNYDVMIGTRADPLFPLQWVLSNVNLCRRTEDFDVFNKQRWNAWEPHIIMPTTGWSPMLAALDAWYRVTAG